MAEGRSTHAGILPQSIERVEAPVRLKAFLMSTFAAFAGVLFGYDSGYISSVLAMDAFKRVYGHRVPQAVDSSGWLYLTWEKSLIVSILSAGTFLGALASGAFATYFGRRTLLLLGCAIFLVGVLLQVSITTILGLAVGRLVAGVGVGFISAVTIIFLSEIAPRKQRGAVVSCYQFAITIGLMLASCICYATQDLQTTAAFRIPIAIQGIWAVILGCGLYMLPESPRYLVQAGQLMDALKALGRLRGQSVDSERLQDELAEIKANYDYELRLGKIDWRACLHGQIRNGNSNLRKIVLGTALQMFQQFTGINFIFYYNTTFFAQAGLQSPFLIAAVTTIVNVVSTPVSFYTIERYGRRPLLIWGALMMCVCQLIVASICTAEASTSSSDYSYIQIIFVCLYVFVFASTWGPTAWVVIGEIYQLPIRAKGVALSTASNWFWNCVIAIIVPYFVDPGQGNLGGKVFFIWGTSCTLCALFAYLLVPETKGLTLEQVDKMMEETIPSKSKAWRLDIDFAEDMGWTSLQERSR